MSGTGTGITAAEFSRMGDDQQRTHLFYKMEQLSSAIGEVKDDLAAISSDLKTAVEAVGRVEDNACKAQREMIEKHEERCLKARQLEKTAVDAESEKGDRKLTTILAIIGIMATLALAVAGWLIVRGAG